LEQDYPSYELILVDDRSEDLTASIAAELAKDIANFKVITVQKLSEGWTGKCHALDAGVRHASGEWLAFLDSDSSLDKSALRQCYQAAVKHKVNMVTLSPKFILKTFWEKALQPAFVVASSVLFPLPKVNDPASPVASANGMFFLISRYAYDKIGGHHEVKGLAVEDIGIGKRVKAAGLGLLFANGRYLLSPSGNGRKTLAFRRRLQWAHRAENGVASILLEGLARSHQRFWGQRTSPRRLRKLDSSG